MNTILIPNSYQQQFFNYISTNHKDCYDQVKIFNICKYESKDLIVPYSNFSINALGSTFEITISHENQTPLFDGNDLAYLLKVTISNKYLELLSELAQLIIDKKGDGLIQIYNCVATSTHAYWIKSSREHGQTIDNIFIPTETKTQIIKHIDSFINNKERYLKFGRVYKLCFLFTGVPGSGKSSLIKAVSIKYNRPIYILNLSKSLTDMTLIQLLDEIKPNSIVVLEDIDAFFVDRDSKDTNVSFSGILNLFDGIFSPGNGIMLFMTANNPERLDHALIRPGRVDKIIKFDYPKKKEIMDAFNSIIGNTEHFTQFYKNISGSQLSMAGIVDYLFRHNDDYLDCISELNEHTKLLHEITEKNSQHLYK
jgi:hypothetical protein